MKRKNLIILSLFLTLGVIGLSRLSPNSDSFLPLEADDILVRTIDFEDLSSGNMSALASNNSFYGGLIVADGKVTKTLSAAIDSNTLGLRVTPISDENPSPFRLIKIQVSGYSKIVLDIKQQYTTTMVSSGCNQDIVSASNQEIVRDVVLPTYGHHEIILTFYPTSTTKSNMDCGIDNIRFYGTSNGESTSTTSASTSSTQNSLSTDQSTESVVSTSEGPIQTYEITIRDMSNFLQTKNTHYPISNEFIEEYQQKSGGYIDLAKSLGLLVDKTQHEPNQKWHFFDSWMQPSIDQGTLSWDDDARDRVYMRLLSPELLLWIYEASGVSEEKILLAKDAAVNGKIEGTHSSTIAKNMRSCVSWDDIRIPVLAYKNSL